MSSLHIGARFSSFKQLTDAIKEYSNLNDVEFFIRDSKNLQRALKNIRRVEKANEDLKYYLLHYCCIFGRKPSFTKVKIAIRKTNPIVRGCTAFIKFNLSRTGEYLELTACNLEHNHERSAEELNRLRQRRCLTKKQKRRAIRLLQSLPEKKMVQQKLIEETGKNVLVKDLTNILSAFKKSQIKLEDDSEEESQLVTPTLCKDNIHQDAKALQEPHFEDNSSFSDCLIEGSSGVVEQSSPLHHSALSSPFEQHISSGKINEAILNMIIKDFQPLSFVGDQGFLDLMHLLAPLYRVPSSDTLSNMLSDKYNRMVMLFKEKFSSAEHLSITCNMWSDITGQCYIEVIAHFCNDFELKAAALGSYALNHPDDHMYLALKLNEICCEEWAINHNKIVAVVSDDGAIISKAIENCFGNQKHLYCPTHALFVIPSTYLEVTSSLKELLSDITSIVSFFEQNLSAAEMLEKVQQDAGEKNILKLKLDVSTHWDSTYYMLQHFLKLSNIISTILIKIPFAPRMLSSANLCAAKDIFKFLKVLKQSTIELSTENYVTCSKVIPVAKTLLNKIDTVQPVSEIGMHFKQAILNEICVCFRDIEEIEILAIATLLDPRFKKYHFQDLLAVATVTNKILKLLSESNNSSVEYELVQNIHENESDEEDFWSLHKKKYLHGAAKENCGVFDELTTYLDQPVIPISSNPLKYWDAMQNVFPNVYKVALKYLSVPATPTPAERLFTKAGHIIAEKRNRNLQNLKNLDRILFLNSNCT